MFGAGKGEKPMNKEEGGKEIKEKQIV